MTISGIQPTIASKLTSPAQAAAASPVDQVGGAFNDMLTALTQSESESNSLASQLATGGSVDLHDVMIGLEQTDIQFKVAMAIRDRLVDAYREVSRMQI